MASLGDVQKHAHDSDLRSILRLNVRSIVDDDARARVRRRDARPSRAIASSIIALNRLIADTKLL